MAQQNVSDLQSDLWNKEASVYEGTPGHGILTAEEMSAWLQDIAEVITIKPGSHCLDVAAGTGVMTRILAERVGPTGHVTATDRAAAMLTKNRELMPAQFQSRVKFTPPQPADSACDNPDWLQKFDLISCRQGVVCFSDPMAGFSAWHQWLKPDGKILILDGMWTRRSWGKDGDWENIIDPLPLACPQSLATIPYLLKLAGFEIEHNAFLPRVNEFFKRTDTNFECPRFAIVASKRK